ncbi:MCE family protein [Actinomadura craniellae]|uniref:MCE family protein n=1 Tax=Actinomadura craniellae TaxID=2231787 RepID=A0A365HAS4_9ACTN|nr:MCE family protein [Actinomadura craniellae]RAY16240.1 MCE family protein [Actinomadura craniellae]
MKPRIVLNLVAFAVLGAVMMVWALSTLVTIDVLERPVRVQAEFASSPGLRTDLEVDYLGVRVGEVGDVRLAPGRVVVDLDLDRGASVPSNAVARVLRKSAVGEPYVELSPPATGPRGRPLRAGDVIPLSRTSVTVEYKRLFESAGGLLRAVPPEDVRVLTRELAAGLEGRGQGLHDTVADLHRLTGTLADNADVLDALAVQLTQLTGTLAGSGPQLAAGVNDLAAFTGTLRGSRRELNGILERSPGFLDRMNALLRDSRPGMSCLLTAMGSRGAPVFTGRTSAELTRALSRFHHQFPELADKVLVKRPEGAYARVTLVLTVAGPVPNAQEYPQSLPDPAEPPLYSCAAARAQGGGQAGKEGTAAGRAPDRVFTTIAPRSADRAARGDEPGTPGWLPLLPVLVAGLVLAGTAVHTVRRVRSRAPRR